MENLRTIFWQTLLVKLKASPNKHKIMLSSIFVLGGEDTKAQELFNCVALLRAKADAKPHSCQV